MIIETGKQPVISLLLLLVLMACNINQRTIILDIGDGLHEEFRQLTDQYPFPAGFRLLNRQAAPDADGILVSLQNVAWQDDVESGTGIFFPRVLSRCWYAPVTSLEDSRESADPDVISGSITVVPLEEIFLPAKALACKGLYPTDPGYRLVDKLVLSLHPWNGRPVPAPVKDWLDSIPQDTAPPRIAWIAAVGDVMPGEGAGELLQEEGIQAVFTDTLPILQQADLLLGNLEAAATTHERKTPKSFNYKFPSKLLSQLKAAGFDYFSLANNHCYDYGEEGFRETITSLKQHNISTSGAGLTPAAAAVPWRTTVQAADITVMSLGAFPRERNGFDGYATATVRLDRAGILWADEDGLQLIRQAFAGDTFNILMVHGGRERTLFPLPEQMELYRHFIDLGADLVLGSHPHVLQGLEAYAGGLIAYSLGNFLFPDEVKYRYAAETVILLIGLYRQAIRYIKVYPVSMKGPFVQLDHDRKGLVRIFQLTGEFN